VSPLLYPATVYNMTTNTNRILIMSEDQALLKNFASGLELLGYVVFLENYAEVEIENILRQKPDAIMFDLTSWDEDTLQIYQHLKSNPRLENQRPGMIILVSENNLSTLPLTLEFDELLLTSCKSQELAFRIKRLLWQKNKLANQEVIKIGSLIIYLARYEVWMGDKRVELTFKEYELLKYLASHRGRAFNRESLLNVVWGYNYYGGTRTVDVHVRRIRAKIGDDQEDYIRTIRGVGYMFRE